MRANAKKLDTYSNILWLDTGQHAKQLDTSEFDTDSNILWLDTGEHAEQLDMGDHVSIIQFHRIPESLFPELWRRMNIRRRASIIHR